MSANFVSASAQSLNLSNSLASFQNVAGATLMAWVRLTTIPSSELTIAMFSTGASTSNPRVALSYYGASARFRASARRLDANSTSNLLGTTAPAAGTVYHVCGTYAFTGQYLRIYVNGVLENSLNIAGWTANTSNTASLGARIGAYANSSLYMNGVITDVRTYQRVLSAAEIYNVAMCRGGDTLFDTMRDRWRLMGGYPGQIITAGNLPSIGSAQGAAAPLNSPTFGENLGIRSRRKAA